MSSALDKLALEVATRLGDPNSDLKAVLSQCDIPDNPRYLRMGFTEREAYYLIATQLPPKRFWLNDQTLIDLIGQFEDETKPEHTFLYANFDGCIELKKMLSWECSLNEIPQQTLEMITHMNLPNIVTALMILDYNELIWDICDYCCVFKVYPSTGTLLKVAEKIRNRGYHNNGKLDWESKRLRETISQELRFGGDSFKGYVDRVNKYLSEREKTIKEAKEKYPSTDLYFQEHKDTDSLLKICI